jgi:alkylhydroperoxidase family enzyme
LTSEAALRTRAGSERILLDRNLRASRETDRTDRFAGTSRAVARPARCAAAAWVRREATVFTEAERAALELTEQGTRIADAAGGVTDEAWANAAKHYDDDQLAALVSLIALINTYNAST